MQLVREVAPGWSDYQLIDSGNFEKLERFGDVVFMRPEPQAMWMKDDHEAWKSADAVYQRIGQEGEWDFKTDLPKSWTMQWEDLTFQIRPTSFKHTGLFPEQAGNWQYIRSTVKPGAQVLNLFGYTGGATLAALSAGADVVHVDASKPVITWAKENVTLSGLADKKVRWIEDDVMKFVTREIKREHRYDMIIMDPPAFGRGPEGELWKFEEHLPNLLEMCAKIMAPSARLIINAYSLGFPALAIEQLVISTIPNITIESVVELTLKESAERGFELPAGIAVRANI